MGDDEAEQIMARKKKERMDFADQEKVKRKKVKIKDTFGEYD